jgi:hypothetical protein
MPVKKTLLFGFRVNHVIRLKYMTDADVVCVAAKQSGDKKGRGSACLICGTVHCTAVH